MSKGISLHVGIDQVDPDHYLQLGALRSAERDALSMGHLARSSGFSSRMPLLGTRATLDAVRTAIASASKRLGAGDTFLFSFAGHGGAVPDHDPGKPGGREPTLCLYDQQYIVSLLVADLGAFRTGVRVVIVNDSCASGTTLRASLYQAMRRAAGLSTALGEASTRSISPELASSIYLAQSESYDAWKAVIAPGARAELHADVIVLSASQELQEARDGVYHGKFTGALLSVWNGGKYLESRRPSYLDLIEQVGALMADPTQVPRLEVLGAGAVDLRTRRPFVLDP